MNIIILKILDCEVLATRESPQFYIHHKISRTFIIIEFRMEIPLLTKFT